MPKPDLPNLIAILNRAHRMSSSDPDDPEQWTLYSAAHDALIELERQRTILCEAGKAHDTVRPDTPYLDIVFDGPPEHDAGRLVEIEDSTGAGVSIGTWMERPNGHWALRIPDTRATQRAIHDLTEAIRLTVEYTGNELLPPVEGWDWFDALAKYAPEVAQRFVAKPIIHLRHTPIRSKHAAQPSGPAYIGAMPPSPETSALFWTMYCRACGVEEFMAHDREDPGLIAHRDKHNATIHGPWTAGPAGARDYAALRGSAWADYRAEYGVHGAQSHRDFCAGWDAAQGTLDIGGVQR